MRKILFILLITSLLISGCANGLSRGEIQEMIENTCLEVNKVNETYKVQAHICDNWTYTNSSSGPVLVKYL